MHYLRSRIASLCTLLNRCSSGHLDYRFSKLLHLHLNDQLLEMPLSATIFLFDDQLTFRLSEALNFPLELIKAINDICLHRAKLFLKLFDNRIYTVLL